MAILQNVEMDEYGREKNMAEKCIVFTSWDDFERGAELDNMEVQYYDGDFPCMMKDRILFFNQLSDKNEMLVAALANMTIEGGAGTLENPHYIRNVPPKYLLESINYKIKASDYKIDPGPTNERGEIAIDGYGYLEWYDYYSGELKNADAINLFMAFPQEQGRKDFGMGLFQFTFERTTDVLDIYQQLYKEVRGDLSNAQKFVAEYLYYRSEIFDKEEDILNYVQMNNETYAAGFRQEYEGNSKHHRAASGNADVWRVYLKNENIFP